MRPVTVREFVSIFLRDGTFTFGGGDPAMAALHNDLTRQRGWLSEDDNGLFYALARLTPGTNILAFCAAAGWRLLGWMGAVLAVSAATIPSAFLVIWLTHQIFIVVPFLLGVTTFIVVAAKVHVLTPQEQELIVAAVRRKLRIRPRQGQNPA